jgi:hypothetical protein
MKFSGSQQERSCVRRRHNKNAESAETPIAIVTLLMQRGRKAGIQ